MAVVLDALSVSSDLHSPSWYRVAELRPRLRSHVRIHRHHYRGELWYVLEDRVSRRMHRFNPVAHYAIGLMDGHRFLKRPPMDQGCGTCHGGRLFPEYTGMNEGFPPDVHFQKAKMDCVACHGQTEMHGDGTPYPNRHSVATKPRCLDCHPEAKAAGSPIEQHAVHKDKINCVVCHSTVYKGCQNCHLGKGATSSLQFKIGRSSRPDAPYEITLLRHVPTVRTMLDPKVKEALPNYDAVPTWKDTTPHNIQRKTPRTASCNNCHGNARIFLKPGDLDPTEAAANSKVVMPSIPPRR